MAITLNNPKVRGADGVLRDYFSLDNPHFTRIKEALRDENIYNKDDSAIPMSDRISTFIGTADVDTALKAFNETRDGKKLIRNIVSDANGDYEFSTYLRNGKNRIVVETVDGSESSPSLHLDAYNFHAWLYLFAVEFLAVNTSSDQTRVDEALGLRNSFLGGGLNPSGKGLTNSYGQYISIEKDATMSVTDWQFAILSILNAYNYAPSVRSMDLVAAIFAGSTNDPDYIFYDRDNRLQKPRYDDDFQPQVTVTGALNITYDTTRPAYFYNRWWTFSSGISLSTSEDTTYVRLDGLRAQVNSTDLSTTHGVVTGTTTRPYATGTMVIEETISSAYVREDTDGSITGLSGELYVRSSYPIGEINIISASVATNLHNTNLPYTDGCYFDLGQAQNGIDKRQFIGDVYLNYDTFTDVYELYWASSDATTVTSMNTGNRYGDAVYREYDSANHVGEIRIPNTDTLNDEQKEDLLLSLRLVKPPHKFFYLFLDDGAGGWTYYGKV